MDNQTGQPEMKMDQLVKLFLQLREKKSQLKKKYEEQVAKIDAVQDKIEALMLLKFQELGVESVRTDDGTAYISVSTSIKVSDMDSFKEFCRRQDDPFTFVDVRANKTAVAQYSSASGDVPPGLSVSKTRVVNFRTS